MRLHPALLVALLIAATGCATDPPADDAAPVAGDPVAGDAVAGDPVAADAVGPADAPVAGDADAPADPLAAMQGEWQSTDDPAVRVRFDGGRFTETYDGETMADEPVRAVDTCEGAPAGADGPFFQVGTDFCYAVVEATPTTLAYMMMGGRGNTLSFRRP